MNENLTLGSLFDGSGGFPLGGLISGITPVWASEIEPFPIRVTTKRLPFMKHYGDVSVLNGAELEPVDIMTFGSPCQDMSMAGRRAGLDGSRSNLFFEAVRIAKEMRAATDGRYPTWLIWENVPGAFSSNGGEDFKAVLDEIRRIKDPEADTPRPAKWPNAGCILADGYSVAWRVFDAQYWGVPQRRKRIYLVADLAGQRAGKVLFESEGLSGYTPEGFRAWQGTAGPAEERAGTSGGSRLSSRQPMMTVQKVYGICSKDCNAMKSGNPHSGFYEASTSRTLDGNGGNPTCNQGGVAILSFGNNREKPAGIAYGIDRATYNMGQNAQFGIAVHKEIEPTMVAKGPGAVAHPVYSTSKSSYHMISDENRANTLVATDYKDPPIVLEEPYYIVRRLTPTECARLQGFPDWWCTGLGTDEPDEQETEFWKEVFETHRRATGIGKPKSDEWIGRWLRDPHSDSAEYKLWGNGVALPCVCFVMAGIVYYDQTEA